MTNKSLFTLVEILVVVCIFMLVMSISLPAFTRIAKGGGVTAGARSLCAKLNGARSYALAHRCYVAMVFPMDATKDPNAPNSLRFIACRPAIVYPANATVTSCVFSKWIDGEPWLKLPSNIFFGGPAYDSTMSTAYNGMVSFDVYCPVTSCTFADIASTSGASDIKICLVFKPDGTLATGNNSTPLPFSIGIWEGAVVSGAIPQPTNKSNVLVVSVNQFTGKASIVGR